MLNIEKVDSMSESLRFMQDNLDETISFISNFGHVWGETGMKKISELILYNHAPRG